MVYNRESGLTDEDLAAMDEQAAEMAKSMTQRLGRPQQTTKEKRKETTTSHHLRPVPMIGA